MGEVYRARDTTLGRDAALKVLPPALAADADRVARFHREARTLAALNHPHIAQVFGVETTTGVTALAMEFVDGEDLEARLQRGALPLDEVLAIARQVAEALDAAHTAGIVHRDLKPANVVVRSDGVVKVLDFGLAKALDPPSRNASAGQAPGGAPNASQSPTITTPAMTHAGVILGTAAYMSQEQARGKAVDKRTDIWAFGCVVYELLTGRQAFEGETVTDVLSAIVRAEPDWTRLPAAMPDAVRRMLRRCLVKDRTKRLPDIAAALLDLDEATMPAPDRPPPNTLPPARRWPGLMPSAVAAILAALLGWQWMTGRSSEAGDSAGSSGGEPVQFVIDTVAEGVPGGPIPQFAVSPDGRQIVFVGTANGATGLWLRDLASGRSWPFPAPTEPRRRSGRPILARSATSRAGACARRPSPAGPSSTSARRAPSRAAVRGAGTTRSCSRTASCCSVCAPPEPRRRRSPRSTATLAR